MAILYTTGDGKQYTAADGTQLVLASPASPSFPPVPFLITDRTEHDVARWKELHGKGWAGMTEVERAEFTGNPVEVAKRTNTVVNLMHDKIGSSSSLSRAAWEGDELVVTSVSGGTYQYAKIVIGEAADFENTDITISFDSFSIKGVGNPRIRAYWLAEDDRGYTEIANGIIVAPGKITFNTGDNVNNHRYFSIFVYSSVTENQRVGDSVKYKNLMVERGSVKHEFVPYYDEIPTPAVKGRYGAVDMNRVESAVEALSARFVEDGYLTFPLSVKTDWNQQSIPTRADMERYLGNVATLRSLARVYPTTPAAPTVNQRMDYRKANDIEQILFDLRDILEKIPNSRFYAGEIYSGEV